MYRFYFLIRIAYSDKIAQNNDALDRMMFPPTGTKQQLHPSVSDSLSASICKPSIKLYDETALL